MGSNFKKVRPFGEIQKTGSPQTPEERLKDSPYKQPPHPSVFGIFPLLLQSKK
jgi:hypothetical protein